MQHLLAERPELRGKCVVLCDTDAHHGRVQYASRLARKHRICEGQSVAEALALAGEVSLAITDPVAEAHALQQLADTCYQFSPKVSLAFGPTEDSLLLDLTGCQRLYPSEYQLTQSVLQHFERQRWKVRLAIADTPSAAWAIARFRTTTQEAPRCLHPKPIRIISSRDFVDTLAWLPVTGLRLPIEIIHQLERLGLWRVGQIQALDRPSLVSRFGQIVLYRLDELYGNREEPLEIWQSPPLILVEEEFETGITNSQTLQTTLSKLTEQVTRILRRGQQGILRLEGRLRLEHAPAFYWQTTLLRPTLKAKYLEELIWLELDQRSLARPVVGIELAVTETAKLESRQYDLFEAGSQRYEYAWQQLAERLIGRLGMMAVTYPCFQPSILPEEAYRFVPISEKFDAGQPRLIAASHRPIQLFVYPSRLRVEQSNGKRPPKQFWHESTCYQVRNWWGPERIQTGWWQGTLHSRDYFRIETEEGYQLWIFRDRQEERWYLHGWFD